MPRGDDGQPDDVGCIDWTDDFPMDEEAEDFAGNVRRFEVTCTYNGLGQPLPRCLYRGLRSGLHPCQLLFVHSSMQPLPIGSRGSIPLCPTIP